MKTCSAAVRSPLLRAIDLTLAVLMLFSTTVSAAGGLPRIALPGAVNTLAAEAAVDWLAATALPALDTVSTGAQATPLSLTADVVAEDGQLVTSLRRIQILEE